MPLDQQVREELVAVLQRPYPGWADFANEAFQEDWITCERTAVARAHALLGRNILEILLAGGYYAEFLRRLEVVGRAGNLLWNRVPGSGDLNILHAAGLNAAAFCQAVFDLLYGPGKSADRLGRYIDHVSAHGLPNKWTFPTYFLFVCHPETEMFVKPRAARWFWNWLGLPGRFPSRPTAGAYVSLLDGYRQVRAALQDFGPQDMVDIQGALWAMYRVARERNKLTSPFNRMFRDRAEADWAFDLLAEAAHWLGIRDGLDPLAVFTLRSRPGEYQLHLSYGHWPVLGFTGHHGVLASIDLLLPSGRIPLAPLAERGLGQPASQPPLSLYTLPGESVRPLAGTLRDVYRATLAYVAALCAGRGASPFQSQHRPELYAAAVDLEERDRLLYENGLQVFGPVRRDRKTAQGEDAWDWRPGAADADGPATPVDAAGRADEALPVEGDQALPISTAGVDRLEPGLAGWPAYKPSEAVAEPQPAWAATQLYDEASFLAATHLSLAVAEDLYATLRDRRQIILYGPPGTGKTYVARELAKWLTGLADPERQRVQMVQFHPAFGYEDFIEGIRPESKPAAEGQFVVDYPPRPGVFRSFCDEARQIAGPCIFVIDEINRGNIPRIFGELMLLLEYRDQEVRLPYSAEFFRIPENVHLIGTMNTADRSIALVDFALRRRFQFFHFGADPELLARWLQDHPVKVPYLLALYRRLAQEAIDDPDYAIGPSYFMRPGLDEAELRRVWQRSIEPYLAEYYGEQRTRLERWQWDGELVRALRQAG